MTNNRWIFLRGLTRGNIHWGDFPAIFQKINPDAEMEFLEIPGNGSFYSEKSPITAEEVILFLKSKSNFCKNNLPFNLCGISLGGMIALKWSELYPEDLASVTIINSSLKQFSPFYKRLMPENYLTIAGALMSRDSSLQEKTILEITSNQFAKNERYLKLFSDFAKNHPVSKENFARQLLLASHIKIRKRPSVPFNVITSKYDRLVDSSCSERIMTALGGKQHIHLTAGHDLPLDEPQWLAEVLHKK